jgi:hypothetical protein
LEDGLKVVKMGAPHGGVISPLLSNLYTNQGAPGVEIFTRGKTRKRNVLALV